jgi:hypothetical protein
LVHRRAALKAVWSIAELLSELFGSLHSCSQSCLVPAELLSELSINLTVIQMNMGFQKKARKETKWIVNDQISWTILLENHFCSGKKCLPLNYFHFYWFFDLVF